MLDGFSAPFAGTGTAHFQLWGPNNFQASTTRQADLYVPSNQRTCHMYVGPCDHTACPYVLIHFVQLQPNARWDTAAGG